MNTNESEDTSKKTHKDAQRQAVFEEERQSYFTSKDDSGSSDETGILPNEAPVQVPITNTTQVGGETEGSSIESAKKDCSLPTWIPLGPASLLPVQAARDPKTGLRSLASGRIHDMAVTPDGQRVYVTKSRSGVWGSRDNGQSWTMLMDENINGEDVDNNNLVDYHGIAVIPGKDADSDTLYVGLSGSLNGEGAVAVSTDSGKTWQRERTEPKGKRLQRIVINPVDPSHILACENKGIYRRETNAEGAYVWNRTQTGSYFYQILASQSNGQVTWFTHQTAYNKGQFAWRSTDGGTTWEGLTISLPNPSAVSYVNVTVQPNNPDVLFIMAGQSNKQMEGLYRYDLTTQDLKKVIITNSNGYAAFGSYNWSSGYSRIAVDPEDANTIYAITASQAMWRVDIRDNEGVLNGEVNKLLGCCWDVHTVTFTPGNRNQLWMGGDQGLYVTNKPRENGYVFEGRNHGLFGFLLTYIAQHPTEDAVVISGTQDNGGILYTGSEVWKEVKGGDSGFTLVNWADPYRMLDTYVNDAVRGFMGTRASRPKLVPGDGARWYAPLASPPINPDSPEDAEIVVMGGSRPYLSEDFASTWRPIPSDQPGDKLNGRIASVAFASRTRFYAGTEKGGVYRFDQKADNYTWRSTRIDIAPGMPHNFSHTVEDVVVDLNDLDGNSIFIVFGGRGDFRSVWHYDGLKWTQRSGTTVDNLSFDGRSNWIYLPPQTWDFSAGFTVEAWVHYDAFGYWARVIDLGCGGRSHNIALHNGRANSTLSFWTHKNGRSHNLNASNVLKKNQWQHLAVTIDTEGKGQILVNGEVVKEGSLPLPSNVERTRSYIGKANDGASSFNGKMSEFRLWNKTRTVAEIKADLFQTLSGGESGLLVHFPMTKASVQNGFIKNNVPGSLDGEYQSSSSWKKNPFPSTHEDNRSEVSRLELSGKNHYVQALAEDALPDQPIALTQEAWIKTTSNRHCTIATRRNAVAQGWPTLALIEGKAAAIIDNPTYRQEIKGTTLINDDNWHHVAVVKDDVTYSLYVDGNLENEVSDDTPLASAEGSYSIGCHPVTQSYFVGNIAEVRVWQVARQAKDIQADSNRLLDPKDNSDLILYYPLDEGTGSTVSDKVSGKAGFIYNIFWETTLPLGGGGCLPSDHFGALAQDHVEKETLYVAGDFGVWRSQDAGAHWHPFSKGLPDTHVKDIKIHPRRRLLRAATWGRGLFEIPLDDTVQQPVKLYIRSTLLDRGIYPTQDQLPHPTERGKTVDYRESPDIKVSLPDENEAFPLPETIDFAQYVNELKDQSEGATNLPKVRVYVQVHNRSADIADGVKVTLLRASVKEDKAPELPENLAQSISNNTSIEEGDWRVLGTQVLNGVKGGLPQIACFTLSTESIAVESSASPTCLLAVVNHEEDTLDSKERDTKQFCFAERKAAIRYTKILQARIQRQVWKSLSGNTLSNLTGNSRFPFQPDQNQWLTAFEGPTNAGSSYGARLLGWLKPPATGTYTFWIASDDHSELRLSTDDNPLNAKRIAGVDGWTGSRQWGKYKSQKSSPIALQAGQSYYLEALHKEGGGGDHIAVAWGGPNIADQTIIDAGYFEPIQHKTDVRFKDYAIGDPKPIMLGTPYQGSLADAVTAPPQKSLIFAKISGAEWLEVKQDGRLAGTPNATALPGINSCRVLVSDNQGNSDEAYIGVTVQFPRISQENWTLHNTPSAQPGTPATNAFNGNPGNIWHTRWSKDAYPHTLEIDLGNAHTIGGFAYLPRQDGGWNGRIADFEFYVSSDGTDWGKAVVSGTWPNNSKEKEVTFSPVVGRYIRLHALSEVNGKIFASAADINVMGFKS